MVHILLLEDNPADVLLVRKALVEKDAEEAIKLLQQEDFKLDLIILDLNLPLVSGHDFLKEYCGGPVGPPCVVFSGSQNEKDREMALKSGAREYIRKPAELRDYVNTVYGIVERWGKRS